jgi:hypothetical protein
MVGDRGKSAPCDLHRSSSPGLMFINKRFITLEVRNFTRHFARDDNYRSGLRRNIHCRDSRCFGEMDRSWRNFVIVMVTFLGRLSLGKGEKVQLSVLTP